MDYVVHKDMNALVLRGETHLTRGTQAYTYKNIISINNEPICLTTSEIAYTYFARDDDGCGLERGKLITKIKDKLRSDNEKNSARKYKRRWKLIWADESLHRFRRKEHEDFWIWNHDFYNASIEDLKYILNLIS